MRTAIAVSVMSLVLSGALAAPQLLDRMVATGRLQPLEPARGRGNVAREVDFREVPVVPQGAHDQRSRYPVESTL